MIAQQSTGQAALSETRWFERSSGFVGRPKRKCSILSRQTLGSWNVEGLGHKFGKLQEIYVHMEQRRIAVLRIQETQAKVQHTFYENGFLVVLSGCTEEISGRANAGVGFIVAPWATSAVAGFRLFSDRLACLRLRVKGGLLNVLSAYAPHSGHSYQVRKLFFDDLLSQWKPTGAHTCCIALGDFNAKLFGRMPGEQDVLGAFVFPSPQRKDLTQTNRDLLIETCRGLGVRIANTFFDHLEENTITCRILSAQPMDVITPTDFSQIDHCLVDTNAIKLVKDIWSDRSATLQTHHFLVNVELDVGFERALERPGTKPCLTTFMTNDAMKMDFCDHFVQSVRAGSRMEGLDDHASKVSYALHNAAAFIPASSGPIAKRPWISSYTLDLIAQRTKCRSINDWHGELDLHRTIRNSVKYDRRAWLDEKLAGGS